MEGSIWILIALLAAAVRWAACGESFWVDELHTAWCASGDWGQVAARAVAGNQQPPFFASVWLWDRASELGLPWLPVEPRLRLPVVAASVASVVLTIGTVRQMTGHAVAAAAVGLAAALEVNHIFYGTELRPYVVIDLAVAAMLFLATGRWRFRLMAMHAVAAAAVLAHITALPVVAGVLIIEHWHGRGGVRASIAGGLAVTFWTAMACYVAAAVAPSLWRDRLDWATMAVGDSPWAILEVWPTAALMLVPWGVWFTGGRQPIGRKTWLWTAVAVVVIVAAFAVSRLGVPLWHRRYLVGTLPPLWVLAGALLAATRWRVIAPAAMIVVMFWHQGLPRWPAVRRGEHWRAAVAWINANAEPGERVWVDPGLIEQGGQPTPVADRPVAEYFAFAVAGPYRLRGDLAVLAVGRSPPPPPAMATDWIIRRRFGPTPPGTARWAFGGVVVTGPLAHHSRAKR